MKTKKKVLFIWPPANSTQGPPLGLACVAGHLKNHRPDIDIKIVDLNVQIVNFILSELPFNSDIARLVRSRWTQSNIIQDALSKWAFGEQSPVGAGSLPDWECHYLSLVFEEVFDSFVDSNELEPDIIGISVCDNGLIASIGLTERLKNLYPNSLLVWGGISMSEMHAPLFLRHVSSIDIIVVGEGEDAILDIVDSYPNLPSKNRLNILTNETSHQVKPSRCKYIPSEPAFDLFDLSIYPALELPVSIARGCGWGKCKFCNENFIGSAYQSIDPVRSAQWALEWQKKFRPISFELIDSAANSSNKELNIFIKTILKGGGLREWKCMLRTSDIDERILESAVSSGLKTVYFGLESFSNTTLHKMSKGTTLLHHIRAIRIALEVGLKIEGDLILFFPTDTSDEIYKSIEFVKRYDHLFKNVNISYSRFVPCTRSNIGDNPDRFGIELLPYSLRLAKHLPTELSLKLLPWDPLWKYSNENKSSISKDLAVAYFELQDTFRELSKKKTLQRQWYKLGDTVVIEVSGHEQQILDRYFLEGKQKDIWLKCSDIISSDNIAKSIKLTTEEIEDFLNMLSDLGFLFGTQNKWTHTAVLKKSRAKIIHSEKELKLNDSLHEIDMVKII